MHSEGKRSSAAGASVKNRSGQNFPGRDGDSPDGSRETASTAVSARDPASDGIRLNKFIASSGLYSRREADRLIEMGEVTVNGRIASPGMLVTGKEKVTARDRIIRPVQRRIVVAYYKPVGVTVTRSDPHAKVTIEDVFRYPAHLNYAGRLDRDSEGLLLMTNDGELINAMMRSANGHEKEYVVRTKGRISDEDLHQMSKGVWLKDLGVRTKPCTIERLGEYTFRIVLTQGLNRQIRRMCRAKGHEVRTLKRVRVLNITLKGLKPGMQRELTLEEKEELYREAGLSYET